MRFNLWDLLFFASLVARTDIAVNLESDLDSCSEELRDAVELVLYKLSCLPGHEEYTIQLVVQPLISPSRVLGIRLDRILQATDGGLLHAAAKAAAT